MEGFVDHELATGGEEKVRAPDHFGDPHPDVIRDNSEFVGWGPIFSPDKKIAEIDTGRIGLGSCDVVPE